MKIAILHYHLNRGGVSRVIASQLQSLDRVLTQEDSAEVAILFGGRAEGWPTDIANQLHSLKLHLRNIPSLDYDEATVPNPDGLCSAIKTELDHLGFTAQESVLHVHNHALGKNISLPGAIQRLAEAGYPLLLQIHDFAEDNRSANYCRLKEALSAEPFPAVLYPTANHIHYAALNKRDQIVLQATGLPTERLHFLPNPVPALGSLPEQAATRDRLQQKFSIRKHEQYLLYPVRAIRRKNLGETILLSVLQQDAVLGVTLLPMNPVERKYYDFWKQQRDEHGYPVRLETGEANGLSFYENLAAADHVVTTSVAEGFGMVYLESWLADRQLSGRNLPEITADFVESGLRYPNMYDRLVVPESWIDRNSYERKLGTAIKTVIENYNLSPMNESDLHRLIDAKFANGAIDFADLDEPLQAKVISKVYTDVKSKAELLSLNPNSAIGAEDVELIARNKALVAENYSLATSGGKLLKVFQRVAGSERDTKIKTLAHPENILGKLLDLSRLQLIRT